MADFAKEDLDAIVQAIGFGIVNDFRSLQSAMRTLADQSAENNRLLGDINNNLTSTDRTLERLEKDIYRQIDARQFSRLENDMERKSKASSRRVEQILNDVQKSLDGLRREAAQGNRDTGGRSGRDDDGDNTPPPSTDAEIGQFLQDVASTGGSGGGGTNLALPAPSGSGIGGALAGAAVLGGVAGAALAGGAMLMRNQDSTSPAALAPAEPAAPQAPQAPSIAAAPNTGAATQTPTASTTGAVSAATQTVGAVTKSARNKALEKITNKLNDWVNKNGDKVLAVLGGRENVKIFGQLTGGTFTFSKYMTDDSWTGLGEEYVMGNALAPAQTKDQNAAYVASVVVNLAILAYLACRDVYTKENYRDIVNGVVRNFDDLGSSEKFQYVKNAGGQIENYLNKLISQSMSQGTAAAASSSTSGLFMSSAEAATAPDSSPDLSNRQQEQQQQQIETGDEGYPGPSGNQTQPGSSQAPPSGGGQAPPSSSDEGGSSQPNSSPEQTLASMGVNSSDDQSDAQVSPDNEAMSVDMASIPDGETTGVSGTTDQVLKTIRTRESGGDYRIKSGSSSASGAYQFIDSTWQSLTNKYGIGTKYKRAAYAPPEVQDAVAGAYVNEILAQNDGDVSKIPLVWYTGNAQGKMSAKALKVNNGLTPRAYQSRWMKDFYRINGTRRADAQTTNGSTESTAGPVAAAAGAVITPLPKAPTDTINLAPPKMDNSTSDDEDEDLTMSSPAIDARQKGYSANPYDEVKNKISFYSDYLQHHFGYLSEEFDLHTSGELTAEEAFKRAMNPLGR